MKQILFLMLLAYTMSCSNRDAHRVFKPDLVVIDPGKLMGRTTDDGDVAVFLGIPYAAPPVGDLRWKAPQPVEKWEGVRACVSPPASAMQADPQPFACWTQEFITPAKPMSEDCLYLNVWTPAKTTDEKLPVMVWIHGGAFTSGSGMVPLYDGTEMARKGVVFITINYRLGIFGFFAHPELTEETSYRASGNYGLLDQIAALGWVQDNIAAFGGDPENVTIAGQSAGAFSVNYLVASPLANGLFHRAIAESGGDILPTNRMEGNTLEQAEREGQEFAARLNAVSVDELRELPADSLLKIPVRSRPVIDGFVLPAPLFDIFSEGKQNDVPLLTGWNANEGNFGGPLQPAEVFRRKAAEIYGEKAGSFLTLFPAKTDEEANQSQTELGGLQIFGLQAWAWMNLQNKTGKSPVFVYHFTREVPHGEGQFPYGAFHTGEVPYAYNNLEKSNRPWSTADYDLADQMPSYWVNFATYGNPNGSDLPEWPACQTGNLKAMVFGDQAEMREMPQKERLEFLEQFFLEQLTQNVTD